VGHVTIYELPGAQFREIPVATDIPAGWLPGGREPDGAVPSPFSDAGYDPTPESLRMPLMYHLQRELFSEQSDFDDWSESRLGAARFISDTEFKVAVPGGPDRAFSLALLPLWSW